MGARLKFWRRAAIFLRKYLRLSSSLRSRRLEAVGTTRAPVLSFTHYFQAPATQASSLRSNVTMNDFPVIGDLVLRTGLWDRQGGKHCKSLQRNVWRGAVSPFKSSVFGQRMPHFAVIL